MGGIYLINGTFLSDTAKLFIKLDGYSGSEMQSLLGLITTSQQQGNFNQILTLVGPHGITIVHTEQT